MTPQQHTQQVTGIALNEASQGGVPEGNVKMLDLTFCEYDYNGTIDHKILALGVQFQDTHGKTYDQYYSAGELTFFVPSDDGAMAVPVADHTRLSDSCNAWKFLASLIECGGDRMNDILARGNVKELIDMDVCLQSFVQPKRQGLIRGGKDPDKEKPIALVISILSWPGEGTPAPAPKKQTGVAGAGKPVQRPTQAPSQAPALGKSASGAGKPPAAKTASPSNKVNGQAGTSTVATSDGDKAIAWDILLAIVLESGGQVTKKDLAKLAFQKAGEAVTSGQLEAKDKTKIVQLIFQDAFLHEQAQERKITFDGAKVGLAE